jgi:hypothetical protein
VVVRLQLPVIEKSVLSKTKEQSIFSKALIQVVRSLNQSMSYFLRYYYLMLTGLGLGIGISIGLTVFSFPVSVLATPDGVNSTMPVLIQPTVIDNHQLTREDSSFKLHWLGSSQVFVNPSSDLSNSNPVQIYVGFRSEAWREYFKLKLGSIIRVYGKNSGVYNFGVINIRELSIGELLQMESWIESEADLVIYLPDFSNFGKFRVILAKLS